MALRSANRAMLEMGGMQVMSKEDMLHLLPTVRRDFFDSSGSDTGGVGHVGEARNVSERWRSRAVGHELSESAVLQDGTVWEKAGVNVSVVYGEMPPDAYRAARAAS